MTLSGSLPAPARALLESCRCFSLGFNDANGPWAVPLYFVSGDDAHLYFTSSLKSRHGQLSDRHPVAVTLFQEPADWRSIRGLQGQGHLIGAPTKGLSLVRELYLAKFPDLARLVASPSCVDEQRIADAFLRNPFFEVCLERLRIIDNDSGFATRVTVVRDQAGSWITEPQPALNPDDWNRS